VNSAQSREASHFVIACREFGKSTGLLLAPVAAVVLWQISQVAINHCCGIVRTFNAMSPSITDRVSAGIDIHVLVRAFHIAEHIGWTFATKPEVNISPVLRVCSISGQTVT
jgi:hypothetical protein